MVCRHPVKLVETSPFLTDKGAQNHPVQALLTTLLVLYRAQLRLQWANFFSFEDVDPRSSLGTDPGLTLEPTLQDQA